MSSQKTDAENKLKEMKAMKNQVTGHLNFLNSVSQESIITVNDGSAATES